MPESKNITPAATPANPPHMTMSRDIPPPPCSTPLTLLCSGALRSPGGLVDPPYGGFGIFHLYNQPSVPFVLKVDHHRLLRIVHVPKEQLALLVVSACRDRPRHPYPPFHDAVPPPARLLRIGFGAFYVRERYLQAAPECEEAVHAFYMDDQGVLGKLHFGHGGVTPFPRAYQHFVAPIIPFSGARRT